MLFCLGKSGAMSLPRDGAILFEPWRMDGISVDGEGQRALQTQDMGREHPMCAGGVQTFPWGSEWPAHDDECTDSSF